MKYLILPLFLAACGGYQPSCQYDCHNAAAPTISTGGASNEHAN